MNPVSPDILSVGKSLITVLFRVCVTRIVPPGPSSPANRGGVGLCFGRSLSGKLLEVESFKQLFWAKFELVPFNVNTFFRIKKGRGKRQICPKTWRRYPVNFTRSLIVIE